MRPPVKAGRGVRRDLGAGARPRCRRGGLAASRSSTVRSWGRDNGPAVGPGSGVPRVHGGWSSGQGTCPALWQDRLMLQLLGFIIDCPDPMKLAAFYSEVTGRAIREGSSDNFAGITFGEVDLAFQRVEDYRLRAGPTTNTPSSTTSTSKWTKSSPNSVASSSSARHCRRTSSDPRATAGRSTPTRSGIPSACAATRGSRGPAKGWCGPSSDHSCRLTVGRWWRGARCGS